MDPITPTAAPAAATSAPETVVAPVAAPSSAPAESSVATGSTETHAPGAGPLLIDPLNFDYDALSDDDKARYDNDQYEFKQDVEATIPKAEDDESTSETDKPADVVAPKVEDSGDASVLSEQEFAALPPKAQTILREAQAMMGDEDFKIFKQSKDALDQLLEDPRVQQVIDQRRRGDKFDFQPEAVFDAKSIEAMAKDAGINLKMIDFATDPEGSAQIMSQVVARAHQMGIDNGKTSERLQAMQKAEVETRQRKYDEGFDALQKSIPGAKEVPYSDPKSPLYPFYQHLAQGLQAGDFTHNGILKMGIKPMYMAWLDSQGKLQELLNKPAANAREKFFQDAQKAATEAAVTASQAKMGGNPQSQASRHGIDPNKYMTDSVYRESILDKFGENDSVLQDLQILEAGGKW